MKKRIFSLILSICLILSFVVMASASTLSGTTIVTYEAGPNLYYTITIPTQLTIAATGATPETQEVSITGMGNENIVLSLDSETFTVYSENYDGLSTTAVATFETLTIPKTAKTEQTLTGDVSATFASGYQPLIKGDYHGTIMYTVSPELPEADS